MLLSPMEPTRCFSYALSFFKKASLAFKYSISLGDWLTVLQMNIFCDFVWIKDFYNNNNNKSKLCSKFHARLRNCQMKALVLNAVNITTDLYSDVHLKDYQTEHHFLQTHHDHHHHIMISIISCLIVSCYCLICIVSLFAMLLRHLSWNVECY